MKVNIKEIIFSGRVEKDKIDMEESDQSSKRKNVSPHL